MRDGTFHEWQDRIQPRLRYWLRVMHLDTWEWHADYERENIPMETTYETGGAPAASVQCNWAYKTLRVRFHLITLENMGDELTPRVLDSIICHELCHAIADELREAVPHKRLREYYSHEERVVTEFAAILAEVEAERQYEVGELHREVRKWRRKASRQKGKRNRERRTR